MFCDPLYTGPNSSLPLLDNFTHNISDDDFFLPPLENATVIPEEHVYHDARRYGYGIVLPAVFIFGVVGNVLNIIIFSKSRFRHSLDEVEKSATTGE